eukprot:1159079-Pelagomonas_calceolata.AAC.6
MWRAWRDLALGTALSTCAKEVLISLHLFFFFNSSNSSTLKFQCHQAKHVNGPTPSCVGTGLLQTPIIVRCKRHAQHMRFCSPLTNSNTIHCHRSYGTLFLALHLALCISRAPAHTKRLCYAQPQITKAGGEGQEHLT